MNKEINKSYLNTLGKYENLYWESVLEDDLDDIIEPYEEIERHLREQYGYDKEHARKELYSSQQNDGWDDDY